MTPRKRHNAFKRCQQVFSNVRLWSWESMREDGTQIAHGMARIGFVWRDLDQKQVTGIITKTNNWMIVCRALCCLNGQTWVESEAMSARAVKVSDFEALYTDMRRGVMASVNRAQVQDVGWIIQSFSNTAPIDDEQLPLFQLGQISEARRNRWLITDSEIAGRKAA